MHIFIREALERKFISVNIVNVNFTAHKTRHKIDMLTYPPRCRSPNGDDLGELIKKQDHG